jgi:Phage gp6-like head-tail connector protein
MSKPLLSTSIQPTNIYTTLQDVKTGLQIEDSNDDTDIQAAIISASRMIDDYCQRGFYQEGTLASPVVKYYTPVSPWYLEIDDLIEPVEIASRANQTGPFSTIWNLDTDLMYEPINNPELGRPVTRLLAVRTYVFPYFFPQTVKITGVWGYSSIPVEVQMACKIQAARLFVRKQSPFGIAGSVELGTVRLSSRLDPDVEMLLKTFRRNFGLAY